MSDTDNLLPLPPNFKDSVEDFRDLFINLINRSAEVGGAGARRWIDGLDGSDIQVIAADAATNLEEFAADAWTVAENNVKPNVPPSDQGGNGV